jgi:hypothetical protein
MPAKNSKLKYGNRDYIFSKKFYDELVKKTGLDLSYEDTTKVIKTHLENIADVIEEEIDGFKLPRGLGYFCAIRYIPSKQPIDWKKSNETGKRVYYNNLGTFGYTATAKMFRVGRPNNNSFYDVFMFKPCVKLAERIIKKFNSGKQYSDFTISDFLEKSRLENLYSKRYRKEIKK